MTLTIFPVKPWAIESIKTVFHLLDWAVPMNCGGPASQSTIWLLETVTDCPVEVLTAIWTGWLGIK